MSNRQSTQQRPACNAALAAAVLTAIVLALPACASRPADRSGLFEPYRTDLPQGNYLTQEMIDQVKTGMTREQVKFALGSALLTPVFRADRWDYVFRYQRANGTSELRRVVVRFGDDRVASIDVLDTLPANAEADDPALPGYTPPAKAEAGK